MARTLKEILEEAKELGDRYVFNELSEEDAKVLESHDVKYNVLYPVGSRKTVDTAVNQDIAQDFSQLRPDLKKSYDFWNSLNKTESDKPGAAALNYQLTNLDNKALLVEAKRENKTVFKGVDHGRKGFDVVKTAELPSCEQLDRVVKRAKFLNPKTVIRIKDNVTDPVLRNKMLIACALNNVKPVGNLPENFNFAELRDFVKQTDAKDYDSLAEILYTPQENEFSFGSENSVAAAGRNRTASNVVHNNVEHRETPAENRTIAGREENKERRDTPVAPVVVNTGRGNGGNNNGHGSDRNNAGSNNVQAGTEVKKESWGRRAWRKAKGWVIGAAVIAASIWGYKSCENKNSDRNVTPVEVVAKPKINSLADLRNQSTLDYLLNDWNKDGYLSVEDFQGVDWNNDGRIDSRDNELAHKIFAIVEKYRQAKNCADDKLLDSIEKEMDELVKKNCGGAKVVKKKTVRKQVQPQPKIIRDTVYVKGDTVYLQPDTVYLKGDTQVVHDTVYIKEKAPKKVEPEKQDVELLSGRRKNNREVTTKRTLNESQTRTVETETREENMATSKGRKLTQNEESSLLNKHMISKNMNTKE